MSRLDEAALFGVLPGQRDWQGDVRLFHEAMGQTVGTWPHIRDQRLRASLIAEEAAETLSALGYDVAIQLRDPGDPVAIEGFEVAAKADIVELADGIADSIYVLLGTAVAAGIDMDPVWAEVQRSNMAKSRGPVRADGKRLKPDDWAPPAIADAIGQQYIDAAVELGVDTEQVDGMTTRLLFPPEAGCAFGCCESTEAAS